MGCFLEISGAQRLYYKWEGEDAAAAHSTRLHPFLQHLQETKHDRVPAHMHTSEALFCISG